jgi:hypothetical protein
MCNLKSLFLFSILIILLVSCKKDKDQKFDSVSNYYYNIVMTSDNKIKEVVYGNGTNILNKAIFQYYDKTFEEDIYTNTDQLEDTKVFYLNSAGLADSSVERYSSTNYQRTKISRYQYMNNSLSEIDYSVFTASETSVDTTFSNSKGIYAYVYANDILTSGFNGQTYSFSAIPNKLGLDLLNIDNPYAGFNVGFNSTIIGKQEDFLISTIQHYNSKDNITTYNYTLNNDGLITEMSYYYPSFDNINFVMKEYEFIVTFNYTVE